MKIHDDEVEVVGDTMVAEEVAMGLHASATAHIMKLLTNLYTNPAKAAVREYTANAWDSHKMSGQKKSVKVTFPTRLQPSFIVEDFGVGMDRDQLKMFGQYGFSTKTDADEENGGFGLGSKVGLALSSQFTVYSVKDGYEEAVVIGLNETGQPVLKFLYASPKPVRQDNGVKVVVPVTNYSDFGEIDIQDFFVGWEPGTITVDKWVNTFSVHDTDYFTPISGYGYLATSMAGRSYDRSSVYGAFRSGLGLVGPVRYDIDWSQVSEMTDKLARTYFSKLVVQLPIGSVDLVPSRETLRYTNRTKDALNSVVRELIDRGRETYVKQINEASNFREALKIRKVAIEQGFTGSYEYNGISMEPQHYDPAVHQTTVTWANVDSHVAPNGKPTFRTDRRSSEINQKDYGDILSLAIRLKEPVLVTGAPKKVENKPRGGGIVHMAGKISSNLARALVGTKGLVAESPEFLDFAYTSIEKSDLDPAILGAFALIIPWSEAEALADAKRREIASAARSGVTRKKKTAADAPIKVTTYGSNGTGYDRQMTLGELDTSAKYILLDHGHIGRRLHRSITTRAGWSQDPTMARAMSRLSNEGYRFITYNKSWKTVEYGKTLTLVDVKDALRQVVKAEYDTFTPGDLSAVHTFNNSVYDTAWAREMPEYYVKQIIRDDTRDWVKTLGSIRELANRVSKLEDTYNVASHLKADLTGINLVGTVSGVDFGERYRLLGNMYINRSSEFELIVEYVNFIDSKWA